MHLPKNQRTLLYMDGLIGSFHKVFIGTQLKYAYDRILYWITKRWKRHKRNRRIYWWCNQRINTIWIKIWGSDIYAKDNVRFCGKQMKHSEKPSELMFSEYSSSGTLLALAELDLCSICVRKVNTFLAININNIKKA